MLIRDAFDIPESTDLDTFITRLDNRDPKRLRSDLASFVLVDSVFQQVDKLLGTVGERFDQGLDVGRFIHGTFGSGKSHLMTVLSKMFESDEVVYEVGDPRLSELRGRHGWIDQRKLLVVRLNMMGKETLVRALFDAYHAALPQGTPQATLTDQARVFELIERDAARIGEETFFKMLVDEKVIPSKGFYEKRRGGGLKGQLSLAAKLLSWRDGDDSVRPESLWVSNEEGFKRISAHARELGYDGIVWMVDEMIIWIRGKTRANYIHEINALSALVDHDGARALPFLVLFAVQQDISNTRPEDLSEKDFHDQLAFVQDRFKPYLEMKEQDLLDIAARRVLKPKPEALAQLKAELDKAFKKEAKAIATLSGELPVEIVRKIYPFHPALLRVLVDVTQVLSRSRTAMAALYGLLEQHAELKVGKFIPVGALFGIIFTRQMVEGVRDRASRSTDLFVEAYDSYERLRGKIEDVGGARAAELHQLVRTALMCQLSLKPHFSDGRALAESLTATNLLRMNLSDVKAITERTGLSHVVKMFRALASADMQVEVRGQGADPKIEIKTKEIDSDALLREARADVTHQDRFAACRKVIDAELGLKLGTMNERRDKVSWRGTKRMIRTRLANVRRLSYAGQLNEFQPAADEEALILVDYPFDEEPGYGRAEDVAVLQNARKRKTQWTLAWLPEHFNEAERIALENVAAVRRIRKDGPRYFSEYAPKVAEALKRRLESYLSNQEAQLAEAIKRVYLSEGQLEALNDRLSGLSLKGRDPKEVVKALAGEVFDKRYPRHPRFKREVNARNLSEIAPKVVEAAVSGASVNVNGRLESLLDAYAAPLELIHPGQGSITKRDDGRYLSAIQRWIGERDVFTVAALYDYLSDDQDQESFGLTEEVSQFFIWYLLHAEGYALENIRDQMSVTVESFKSIRVRETQLRKAVVVSFAEWRAACDVAEALLGLQRAADVPAVPEQSRLSRHAAQKADQLARVVQGLYASMKAACEMADVDIKESQRGEVYHGFDAQLRTWAEVGQSDVERVRALATAQESSALADWQGLLSGAGIEGERKALVEITNARLACSVVSRQGSEAQRVEVITALRNLLLDSIARPLAEHAPAWAKRARRIADELTQQPPPPPPLPERPLAGAPPPPPPPEGTHEVHEDMEGRDRKAIRATLERLLREMETEAIDCTITLREKRRP